MLGVPEDKPLLTALMAAERQRERQRCIEALERLQDVFGIGPDGRGYFRRRTRHECIRVLQQLRDE